MLKIKKVPHFKLSHVLATMFLIALTFIAGIFCIWLIKPSVIWAAEIKVIELISKKSEKYPLLATLVPQPIILSPSEIPLPPWKPYESGSTAPSTIRIGNRYFENLPQAASALKKGDTLVVGEGIYRQALVIKPDNVTLVGKGHVVLEGKATQGKGAIVIDGDGVTIRNIDCRNIEVPDQNGACVRLQGKDLSVQHVYFHDSQQGILTGHSPGHIEISDSRFENLGYGGRAHGIYIGGGSLSIENSTFLRSKGEGHEIKSRSKKTRIYNTIVASLDGEDSRLIDLPHGGDISIERCILEQGPNSANYNLIGIGLEGGHHEHQKLVIRDNIIIMERSGEDLLLHADNNIPTPISSGNLIIGEDDPKFVGQYLYFKNRKLAGLKPFPFLPKPPPDSPIPDKLQ